MSEPNGTAATPPAGSAAIPPQQTATPPSATPPAATPPAAGQTYDYSKAIASDGKFKNYRTKLKQSETPLIPYLGQSSLALTVSSLTSLFFS